MSNFATSEVPGWRLVLWGVVATLVGAGVGIYQDEPYLVIPVGLGGFLISGIFYFIQRSIRNGWAARHLRTIMIIYVIGQAILFIWWLLDRGR